jgi:cryptochrome
MKARVIYWFRTDLRLHDSPALKAALDLQPEYLWPIWCWDPHYVYRARVGSNRWQFLYVYLLSSDLMHRKFIANP